MDDSIDVAAKIDVVRVEKALAVSQLARELGSRDNVFRSFLKANNPTVSKVYELAVKLGVSVAFLVSSEEVAKDFKMVEDDEGNQVHPNVAARVAMVLKEKGLFKARISERIGVTSNWWPSTLQKNNPNMRTLARLAHALEVDPVDLITPPTDEEYGAVMMPQTRAEESTE